MNGILLVDKPAGFTRHKKTSIEILNVVLTILVGIVTLILCARRIVWLKVSRNILQPHFGIETKAYRKWHDKRSAHIQQLLDKEHKDNINIISCV